MSHNPSKSKTLELNVIQQFLLKEYDSASQLTYHIDELRNKLTGFFMLFTGVAVGAFSLILKGEARHIVEPVKLTSSVCVAIAILGVIVVGILARLRKVQLEHFRIINNIREYFLTGHLELWNVVELSHNTLPMPRRLSAWTNRSSGSYLWVFIIMLVNGLLVVASIYLVTVKVHGIASQPILWIALIAATTLFWSLQDRLYFAMATPPPPRSYDTHSLPL
jgi:hypothetical protein